MMSQIEENNFVVQTSVRCRSLKGIKKYIYISSFGVDFEICNFVDRFRPKHTHYTLTNIQKVKKHNRTPLKYSKSGTYDLCATFFVNITGYISILNPFN